MVRRRRTWALILWAITGILTGCASGMVDVTDGTGEMGSATITAAHRYYVFTDYDCSILSTNDYSTDEVVGAKRVVVAAGPVEISAECRFVIALVGLTQYRRNLSFIALPDHRYSIRLEYTRGCIIIVDEKSDAKVAESCSPY